MTLKELKDKIENLLPSYGSFDVFVDSPDNTDDYFLDNIAINKRQEEIHLQTAQ